MNGLFHTAKQWVKIKRMAVFSRMDTLLDETVSKHNTVIAGLNASSSQQYSFVSTCAEVVGSLLSLT